LFCPNYKVSNILFVYSGISINKKFHTHYPNNNGFFGNAAKQTHNLENDTDAFLVSIGSEKDAKLGPRSTRALVPKL